MKAKKMTQKEIIRMIRLITKHLVFLYLLSYSCCYAKNIESDSIISFSQTNCKIEINYFSTKLMHSSGIKGYYFFVKVNSNFDPLEKISDWIKLLDKNGKPVIPKSKYIEFDKVNYKNLYSSTNGIIYYVLDSSESGIHEIKILDKEEERNENLNSYDFKNFKIKESKEFKLLNFKKDVIEADYLFRNYNDTTLFNNLAQNSLINDIKGFHLFDDLRLKVDLYSKKVNSDDSFSILPYYETMFKNGNKDISFLNNYCYALERVANILYEKQNFDSSKFYCSELSRIASIDSLLFNYEIASKYMQYACEYKSTQEDEYNNRFPQIINSIEEYESKFKFNLRYKYKFYLLLGNIKYLQHKDDDARFYYNKIIESSDAPDELKQKAIKNYNLIKTGN